MKTKLFYAVLTFAFSLISAAASATTITFDPLAASGIGFSSVQGPVTSTYTENGFQLQTGHVGFGSAHTGDVDFLYNGIITTWYYGSTSLFLDDLGTGQATLSKVGGGAFKLSSIDLAALNTQYTWPGHDTVVFTGNVHGGGTVTQSFTWSEQRHFHTFAFTGFDNVDAVFWTQGFPYHQFDNIVLDQAVQPTQPGDVPEPTSVALLGLGLVSLVLGRYKRGC